MPGFAGFDISDYPGDSIMNRLKANTNLAWCGYYLAPAPSHPDTGWMGKRASLSASDWGIAPLYVGQQIGGRGSLNPSASTGETDGKQAADFMDSEEFPAGSYVYLDLENGPPLTKAFEDYFTVWCDTVQAGTYQPGIYCSHLLAVQIHNLRPDCRIWAFRVETTKPHPVPSPYPDPNPSGSGYVGAYAWQLGQNCIIKLPPSPSSPMTVDLDSAITVDPGAPDPAP